MAKTRTTVLTQGIGGRVGGLQYVSSPFGTLLKEMPGPRTRFSEGETAQQNRVRRIGAAWRRLGPEEVARWRDWDEAGLATTPAMRRRPAAAYNAFLALSTRLLMIDSRAELPRLPPEGWFGGDAVRVAGEPLSPQPPLQDEPLGEGESGVLFRAARANAPGVLTDLMAQRLVSGGRTPRPKAYASQRFVAFAEGSLEAAIPCPPGWYACAYRFVEADSGRATDVFPCGIVGVGIPGG